MSNALGPIVRRGEIWWAYLPNPVGSGPGYRRPLLVIQSNEFNESRIRTVVAVAVTSNLARSHAAGNVLCSKKDTGLPRDSVVNVSQILTVDKRQLTERIGRLTSRLLDRVEDGVRLVLALR